jgi:Patatin-like phospholipase
MEILIRVPPWAAEVWETIHSHGQAIHYAGARFGGSVWDFVCYQRNAVWLVLSMVIFWPLWVYFAVAVTTASTWVFWLIASISLGILQVVYVTYQFIMIAANIIALTFLKTYQVLMRSWLIQNLFFFSKRIRKSRQITSRHRKWRMACEEAQCYSDFLGIPVLEPKGPDPTETADAALGPSPKMKARSRSMMNLPKLETLHEGDEGTGSPGPSPTRRMLVRSLSSGDRNDSSWSHGLSEDEIPPILKDELGSLTAHVLLSTTERLREARKALNVGQDSNLAYLLTGVVKRNHLTIEDLLANNARSVANGGQHELSATSRKAIANYYDSVSKGLDSLSEAPVLQATELKDRINLVRKMKQNMGRTALMLSGGGAQAMYHLGTIRALVDAEIYNDIHVISGTSGGSITAACCAMFSAEELYETICVRTVSTDFRLNGEMKRKNIRWFPPIMDMGAYWLKHRLLVDSQVSSFGASYY